MTTNSLPFIFKTPDRPIKKVEPKAPERPNKNESYKIYKSDHQTLPQIGFVKKFLEKINDEQNKIDKQEWTTVTSHPATRRFNEQSSQNQSEWTIVDHRKKHYSYPKYDVYVKQKHYCGNYDCKEDCGVLWCGCIDVCRKRCGESF